MDTPLSVAIAEGNWWFVLLWMLVLVAVSSICTAAFLATLKPRRKMKPPPPISDPELFFRITERWIEREQEKLDRIRRVWPF